MTAPGYVAVVVLHVLAAVVGFGALGMTGAYAAALRRNPARAKEPAFRRYFRPGPNWAARALVLVPLLGGALLGVGHGGDVAAAFPWVGLGLWTIAAGIASVALWPAERAIQRLLADEEGHETGELVAACARCERAAAATTLLFVAAVAIMVVQP